MYAFKFMVHCAFVKGSQNQDFQNMLFAGREGGRLITLDDPIKVFKTDNKVCLVNIV